MMWNTLWQFLPLIVLAVSGAAWMVRDLAHSTSTTRQRPKNAVAISSSTRTMTRLYRLPRP